jgi:hypothetical protein
MRPWRLFIASSGKALRYAKAVKVVIDQQCGESVCFLWNQGSFDDGRSFLDSLELLPDKYNAGLAIFTADDQLGDLVVPRDNVILELGLFLGVFKRARTFLLVEGRPDLKLPSDYDGITTSRFYPVDAGATLETHRNSVLEACTRVVERLNALKPVPEHADSLRRIEANWLKNYSGQEFKLYSFCGLKGKRERVTAGSDEEEVYYLWADAAAGNSIRTRVLDVHSPGAGTPDHLWQIEFENMPGSFPSNVAFRLAKRSVVSSPAGGFQQLRFSARIPSPEHGAQPTTAISIGVRIVDALTTHWEYCYAPHEYRLLTINPDSHWQEFFIPLTDPDDWEVFASDGNYLYHDAVPDFSQILAVVIEVGSLSKGRPGAGKGTLQLKDFKVV